MSKNIAILGAGFGGLAAAYDLVRAGHQVTIYESAGSAGGLVEGVGLEGEVARAQEKEAVEGVPGRPTQQAYQVFGVLRAQLDERQASLQQILETDLASFNRLLQSKNLEPVVPRRESREVI